MRENTTNYNDNSKETNRENITGSNLSANTILPLTERLSNERQLELLMWLKDCHDVGFGDFGDNCTTFLIAAGEFLVYECNYFGRGVADATLLKKVKDEEGNEAKDENGLKLREPGKRFDDIFAAIDYEVKRGNDIYIYPGELEGGIEDRNCKGHHSFFIEIDDASIADQWKKLQLIADKGLRPSLVIFSGSKSLHIYFKLNRMLSPEEWRPIQRKLIAVFNSDIAIQTLARKMRFPGVYRSAKNAYQEVQYYDTKAVHDSDFVNAWADQELGLVGDWDEKRWSNRSNTNPGYVQLRNAKASAEVIRTFLQTKPVEEPKKTASKSKKTAKNPSFKVRNAAKKHGNTERGDSDAPSLTVFIKDKWVELITEGAEEGSRHNPGLVLASHLKTVTTWLDEYDIPHADDAEELFREYCDNSWDSDKAEYKFDNLWGSAGVWDNAEPPLERFYLGRLKQWLVDEEKEDEVVAAVDQRLTELNGEHSQRSLKRKIDDPDYKLPTEQKRLNSWNPATPIISTSRFLSQDVGDKVPDRGVVNVQAKMGVGKSYLVKQILQKVRDRNPKARIVSVTPTTSIGKAQASDWEIVQRDDIPNPEKKSMGTLIAAHPAVSMPFDSLRCVEGQVDVLVVDEADTGLSHALFSSTVAKNGGRDVCLANLRKIMQNPNILVLILDANLSNPVAEYFQCLNPVLPVTNIISERKALPWDVDLFADSRQSKRSAYHVLTEELKAELEANQNVCIPTDSQAEAKALAAYIKANHAKYKVISIHSGTSKTKDIKQVFADINNGIYSKKPTVLIYSPSLGQGASITVTKDGVSEDWEQMQSFFDVVIGFFFHLPPFKVMQMLGRVRHPLKRKIWVNTDCPDGFADAPTTTEGVMEQICDDMELVQRCMQQAKIEAGEGATPREIYERAGRIAENRHTNPELKAMAQLKAREAYQQQNRGQEMYRLLTEKGHRVKVTTDRAEGSAISDSVKESKEEVKVNRAQAVAKVDTSGANLEDLSQRATLDYKQQRQSECLRFEKLYPGFVDEIGAEAFERLYLEDVIGNRSKWLKAVSNDFLLQHPEIISNRRFKELQYFVKRFKEYGIANTQDLKQLNTKLDFILKHGLREKLTGTFKNNDPALIEIFEPLTKGRNAKKLKELFGINVKAKRILYILWANKVLETYGYELKEIAHWKEEVNGKRTTIREYAVQAVDTYGVRDAVYVATERRYSTEAVVPEDTEIRFTGGFVTHPLREQASAEIRGAGRDKAAVVEILNEYCYYPSDLEGYFEPHDYQALIDLLGDWVNECRADSLTRDKEVQWAKAQLAKVVNDWESLSAVERSILAVDLMGTDEWYELSEELQEELSFATF